MAALIDAIDVKRKMFVELENVPFYCLEAEISTPTARGGQTLVRLKLRNMLTRAVFDRTFKASDKFKEPDLQTVRGDTASGSVTKPARLETGIEVRVPFFIKEGEKIKVDTETRQFSGRA